MRTFSAVAITIFQFLSMPMTNNIVIILGIMSENHAPQPCRSLSSNSANRRLQVLKSGLFLFIYHTLARNCSFPPHYPSRRVTVYPSRVINVYPIVHAPKSRRSRILLFETYCFTSLADFSHVRHDQAKETSHEVEEWM